MQQMLLTGKINHYIKYMACSKSDKSEKKQQKSTSVETDIYPHMPILHPHAVPCTGRFVRFSASGGAKFTKICHSLPWMPMNHRAKCDAASFILAEKTITVQTNKQ